MGRLTLGSWTVANNSVCVIARQGSWTNSSICVDAPLIARQQSWTACQRFRLRRAPPCAPTAVDGSPTAPFTLTWRSYAQTVLNGTNSHGSVWVDVALVCVTANGPGQYYANGSVCVRHQAVLDCMLRLGSGCGVSQSGSGIECFGVGEVVREPFGSSGSGSGCGSGVVRECFRSGLGVSRSSAGSSGGAAV